MLLIQTDFHCILVKMLKNEGINIIDLSTKICYYYFVHIFVNIIFTVTPIIPFLIIHCLYEAMQVLKPNIYLDHKRGHLE